MSTLPGGEDRVLVILASSQHVRAVPLHVTKLVTVEPLALEPTYLSRDVFLASVVPASLAES